MLRAKPTLAGGPMMTAHHFLQGPCEPWSETHTASHAHASLLRNRYNAITIPSCGVRDRFQLTPSTWHKCAFSCVPKTSIIGQPQVQNGNQHKRLLVSRRGPARVQQGSSNPPIAPNLGNASQRAHACLCAYAASEAGASHAACGVTHE